MDKIKEERERERWMKKKLGKGDIDGIILSLGPGSAVRTNSFCSTTSYSRLATVHFIPCCTLLLLLLLFLLPVQPFSEHD